MSETAIEYKAVKEANERFYRALENADLHAMAAIWLHDTWVKCVHPGWD
ncbi:MAG: nuclear transport factor 2 family protein, partial [Acidobacteriota bacterium]|nr:nuclear transport factor 2 family protein [Acidobacteriota bacterium]